MLENLPIIKPESVQAQKPKAWWRDLNELECLLGEVGERNPLLLQQVEERAANYAIDLATRPELKELSGETIVLFLVRVRQALLEVLDLIDIDQNLTK